MDGNPIPIIHVDLDGDLIDLRPASPEVLLVFWAAGLPVGQAYAHRRPDGSVATHEMAREAVDPWAVEAARAARAEPDGRRVSVVICTRDRPDDLARCLASFAGQTRRPDQVLVVDNASRDGRTREAAEQAGVSYVREDRPGLDIARNTGALTATGDIVAYTDDDVALHPRWLERLVAAFDEDDVMAVTGLVLPAELETRAQQIFEKHWGFGRGFRRIDFGREFFDRYRGHGCPAWEVGAGASMAFRREVFDRIGLFDERLDVGAAGCSGDSEYWYRVLAAGWRCRYEPTAVAFHYHRRSMDGLARQIHAYMRGHVAALMVQSEGPGRNGNLRRAFVLLPGYLTRRALQRLTRGRDNSNHLIGQEIAGSISGLLFYLRTRRPAPGPKR